MHSTIINDLRTARPVASSCLTSQRSRLSTIVLPAIRRIDDQILLSQGQCVDILLDLYLATDDIGLRWSIGERIEEIRGLTVVLGEDMLADLDAILDIAESTDALEAGFRAA